MSLSSELQLAVEEETIVHPALRLYPPELPQALIL
jgi:hypothetical protein